MTTSAQTDTRNRATEGAAFLFGALRARPIARLLLSGLSVLLAVIGTGMLAYPFTTNLYQGRLQERLEDQITEPGMKAAYAEGEVPVGDPLTRIVIEKIGVDVVVVQGTSASALRAGAGHYVNTPLPGEEGNVGIAGHRTTYGKPFADIDKLLPGDEIALKTPIGTHHYVVSTDPFVVDNTEWSVISQSPGHLLTLTSCHPKGSSRQRIVVRAEMVPDDRAAAESS